MRQRRLQLLVTALAALVFWTGTAEAQGNWAPGDFGSLRFRLGIYQPQANSEYWDTKFEDFTGSAKSFEDLIFGAEYLWMTSRQGGIAFGVSFFEGEATQFYEEWVDAQGNDIGHLTTLQETDLTAVYIYRIGRGSVRPYVGAGGGLLWWRLREEGSFIDFGAPDLPVVFASYRADGTTWELLGLAGVDIALGFKWSFFFEGRYRYADAELNKDFSGFGTIDLSGYELSGGIAYRF